jgi:hypothetical protein
MGISASKQTIDQKYIYKLITDIVVNQVSTCGVSISQNIDISSTGCKTITIRNSNFRNIAQLDAFCFAKQDFDGSILNKIITTLQVEIQKQKDLIPSLLNLSKTEIDTYVENEIRNNINITLISNCINSTNQSIQQSYNCAEGGSLIIEDVTLTNLAVVFSKCLNDQLVKLDLFNELKTESSTSIKETSIFSSLFFYIFIVFIIIIISISTIIIIRRRQSSSPPLTLTKI